MNILSLFDGISCGQVALARLGVKIDNYYASEIDTDAIKVASHHHPKMIHLGDVKNVRGDELPQIDVLIGGSPCTGFSSQGKQLNFNDPQSRLFFEYVRVLKEVKPKYFLLENVNMRKEYQDIISSYLGVLPVKINSALVSAQNRSRLYWTNLPVDPIQDRGIVIKSILENPLVSTDFTTGQIRDFRPTPIKPSLCTQVAANATSNYFLASAVYSIDSKSCTLLTDCRCKILLTSTMTWRHLSLLECERLQTLPDYYTLVDTIKKTQRRKMIGNAWTVDVIAHLLKHLAE